MLSNAVTVQLVVLLLVLCVGLTITAVLWMGGYIVEATNRARGRRWFGEHWEQPGDNEFPMIVL